jgi:hypothetical protein
MRAGRIIAALAIATTAAAAADLKVAAFRADVTPALGEPLIWTAPAKVIQDPLWAKGVVIQNGAERYVLCALDWCGVGNRTHALFRGKVAEAAGTTPDRVAFQSVHQHTAPYVDASAYDKMRAGGATFLMFSDASLEALAGKVADAVRAAVAKLEPFDRIGTAATPVDRVASARRLHSPDGKLATRFSTSGKDPAMAAAPEGNIDRDLHTVSFARGDRVLVRLHYYATHPQTFCCEGTVTGDIAGTARERFEREEGIPQIYFTGGAGNVTVGKYNDGTPAAREALASRLYEAMKASPAHTRFTPARKAAWESVPVTLPKAKVPTAPAGKQAGESLYRRTLTEIFVARTQPLDITMLAIGPVRVVNLPGEPMLEFQQYAESLAGKGRFVAFAGYGDIAPGYLCIDSAYPEGGYEPSASNAAPGAEAALKSAIKQLLK